MNRKAAYIILAFLFISNMFFVNIVFAQKSKGGIPLSISEKLDAPQTIEEVPSPNWEKIKEEDKGFIGGFRFAIPIDVNFDTENHGEWTSLPNGGRVWRITIRSKEALGLAVAFDDFELPEGAKMYMYSTDFSKTLGAYDADNNPKNGRFLMGLTKGEATTIEYVEPKKLSKAPSFRITKIYHAYQKEGLQAEGFGMSLPCEVNINCPQGASWQTAKKGVVRIRVITAQGMGWCSGSLINNTREDGMPYILSAYHCADNLNPDFDLWTFYFNYESANCNNPSVEPTAPSIQGCVARSGYRENDFLLLEMAQRVPTNYNAQYLGWNRDSLTLAAKSTMIHHPQGDIKKISLDNEPITVSTVPTNWGGGVTTGPRSHIQSIFDIGTMEPGSSGSPLLDPNGRIIGQLHGGATAPLNDCIVDYALSGWLAKSWDGGGTVQSRLKDWLDPLNTGALTLGGNSNPVAKATVSGNVKLWKGTNLPNVKVYIGTDSTLTDASGNFTMQNVPIGTAVPVRLSKNDTYENGIDAVDILLTRRHLLGLTDFNSPYKLFCADVDSNADADAADILQIRRLLLGLSTRFPGTTAWRFISERTSTDPAFPFGISEPSPLQVTFSGNVVNFNFLGYKKGDVDGSADTGN
jgi:lysyl endopeptidase